jgi:hypothetical protein
MRADCYGCGWGKRKLDGQQRNFSIVKEEMDNSSIFEETICHIMPNFETFGEQSTADLHSER